MLPTLNLTFLVLPSLLSLLRSLVRLFPVLLPLIVLEFLGVVNDIDVDDSYVFDVDCARG